MKQKTKIELVIIVIIGFAIIQLSRFSRTWLPLGIFFGLVISYKLESWLDDILIKEG
jgi:hypothetical protein